MPDFQDSPAIFRSAHKRKYNSRFLMKHSCGCIPGAVKLFCSTEGYYYPCEKTETSDSLNIGDVWSGIDSEKVESMINYFSEVTECSTCKAKRICSLCPAHITENKMRKRSATLISEACEKRRHKISLEIARYISLMERCPTLFSDVFGDSSSDGYDDDWLRKIFFVYDQKECCEIKRDIRNKKIRV